MFYYYNVSDHFYADDTQIYFKINSKDQGFSKLKTVLNIVQTFMIKRKLNFDKDKTNIIVVTCLLQMKNIDLPSNLRMPSPNFAFFFSSNLSEICTQYVKLN